MDNNICRKYDDIKEQPKANQKESYRIAVIDDDPSFRSLMHLQMVPMKIEIDSFPGLTDVPKVKMLKSYDALLVDYYLDEDYGTRVANFANCFFPNVPVVLVSAGVLSWGDLNLTDNIKAILPKSIGPDVILSETVNIIIRNNSSQSE